MTSVYNIESPNDVQEQMNQLTYHIKNSLYVCKVGRIKKIYAETRAVDVEIAYLKEFKYEKKEEFLPGVDYKAYPIIKNIPLCVPFGTKGGVQPPIALEDTCMVFFCDNNFATFRATGANKIRPSDFFKLHGINNAFAMVNMPIEPSELPPYEPERLKISYGETEISLDDLVEVKNEQSNLKAVLQTIVDAITKIQEYSDTDGLLMSATLLDTDIKAITDEIDKLLK